MNSTSPNSTSPPAGIPSGNGKYVAVAAVLVVALGGILVWKFVIDKPAAPITVASSSPPPVDSEAEARRKAKREKELIPPREPDPVPDPVVPAPDPTPSKSAGPRATYTGGGGTAPPPADDCSKCSGSAGPDLAAAVRSRMAMAQSCYQKALQRDSTLQGKVSASVRISATGRICGANANGDVGGGVPQCVAGMLRSGSYPPAQGGCVDVTSTLNFAPK